MSAAVSANAVLAKRLVTVDVRPDGIAFVTMNDRAAALNTITPAFGEQLLAALDRIEADSSVKAAVLVSGKKDSFVVGANVQLLRTIKFAEDAERMAKDLAFGLARVARGTKPFVAAVHGAALGGGFELALACHAIVASDDQRTVFGLPEVKLGLIPAANGLLRVAERSGLKTALDLGLTGKDVLPRKARSLGLVDEVCAPAILVDVACEHALALATRKAARAPRPKGALAALLESNPLGRTILFRRAREETRKRTRGNHPATERILDVLQRFGSKGFASAAALEAKSFGELVVSETAHRLIEVFFAQTALKKDTGVDERVDARAVELVSVLGGGLMGGGIAYVTAKAGVPVRMKERDDASLGRGLEHVRGLFDARVKRTQMTPLERDAAFARVTGATDYSGLKRADVVIEAVFEDLALKQAIVRDVEAVTSSSCIFASNTSSIPIAKIAEASTRPETVVGMHYFSPVDKMPLVEVVRTDATAPWVIATVVALGKKQGKTVIVVKDGVGFYTSRILGPYMNEAAHLVSEGVPIDVVDDALVLWGFPVGPIQLLDEVGIDVAAHVGEIVHAAFGDRMTPPPAMAKLLADDRKGRKNARGFYRYDDGARPGERQVDTSIYEKLGVEPKAKLPIEEIQMRCTLQMVNEALHCEGDGILRSPRDGDVGAIFGLGFPPFRGGPFRWVDTLGAAEVLRRVQGYHDRFGRRWAPAPRLVDLAKSGARFFA